MHDIGYMQSADIVCLQMTQFGLQVMRMTSPQLTSQQCKLGINRMGKMNTMMMSREPMECNIKVE